MWFIKPSGDAVNLSQMSSLEIKNDGEIHVFAHRDADFSRELGTFDCFDDAKRFIYELASTENELYYD